MKKVYTLCYISQDDKILLGLKKRGFGQGRWNGFGGKVGPDETIEAAALREMKEEVGLDIVTQTEIGVNEFSFKGKPDILEVHIFKVSEYTGTPAESDEMMPRWFELSEIPYTHMWSSDPYWFPIFLQGKKFKGKFLFDHNDQVVEHSLQLL